MLSFLARLFSRVVLPRGLAILLSLLLILGLLVVTVIFLAPPLVEQVGELVNALPRWGTG
jgi:predicted PurR-regulated permease PerM